MAAETEKQVSDFYAVLPHADEAKIWMLREGGRWVLPHIRTDEDMWYAEYHRVNRKLEQVLGFQVVALRYIRLHTDRDPSRIEVIYVLESPGDSIPDGNGSWVGREALNALGVPKQKDALSSYFDETEKGEIPALRPPWSRPGYFEAATEWIEAHVADLGHKLTQPLECVKSWGISCVTKAHTTGGAFFLKESSTLPLFADEPAVTAGLAKLFPDRVPNPVAIHPDRPWMLLADFGKPLRNNEPGPEIQEAMFRCFGQIQVSAVDQMDALFGIGCLDRRLVHLVEQIDALTEDPLVVGQLSEPETKRLRESVPRIKEKLEELSAFGVPETLVHGDLHLGNVAGRDGEYLFFDWTDGCVTHPFFDMLDVYGQKDEELRARLQNAYLTVWTEYETMDRLQKCWKLAESLYNLHHAVSYQHITASLEAVNKHELDDAPRFLRSLLSHQDWQ